MNQLKNEGPNTIFTTPKIIAGGIALFSHLKVQACHLQVERQPIVARNGQLKGCLLLIKFMKTMHEGEGDNRGERQRREKFIERGSKGKEM